MSILEISFQKFQKVNSLNIVNQKINMDIFKHNFVWAFIKIGKEPKTITDLAERLYKYYYISHFVNFGNHVQLKKIAKKLDPTDKNFLAYNLGMAITNLIANDIFDVKRLYHISQKKYQTLNGTYDLVGKSYYGYTIFESKGSTNRKQGRKKALDQVKLIGNKVNNTTPSYKIAIIQGFNKLNQMVVDVIDPINNEGKNIELNEEMNNGLINTIDMLFKKYNMKVKYLNNLEVIYTTYLGIEIGYVKNYFLYNNYRYMINTTGGEYFIGNDGIYVRVVNHEIMEGNK